MAHGPSIRAALRASLLGMTELSSLRHGAAEHRGTLNGHPIPESVTLLAAPKSAKGGRRRAFLHSALPFRKYPEQSPRQCRLEETGIPRKCRQLVKLRTVAVMDFLRRQRL